MLRFAVAGYLVVATVYPVLGLPLVLVDLAITSEWGGPRLSPVLTPYLLQESTSFARNLSLLGRNDIRKITLEYRLEQGGSESVANVEVRCVETDLADIDDGVEVRYFNYVPEPVGGELEMPIGQKIKAYSVPTRALCYATLRHDVGSQRRLVFEDALAGASSIYVIESTQNPPSITKFGVFKEPLSAGGVTVHPPIVTDVSHNGHLSLAELMRYAPPFRTRNGIRPIEPAAVANYRPAWVHADKPVATFTEVTWWKSRSGAPTSHEAEK